MRKLLKELNLTPVKKTVGRNPIIQRRESLIKGIDKQLFNCESLISDNEFARDHQTGRKIPSSRFLDLTETHFGKSDMGGASTHLLDAIGSTDGSTTI
jgi:hypothetical protein